MKSIERSCICGPLSFSYILWPTQDLMDSHLLPGIFLEDRSSYGSRWRINHSSDGSQLKVDSA